MRKQKRRNKNNIFLPIFIFELVLICALSVAACKPDIIIDTVAAMTQEDLFSNEDINKEQQDEEQDIIDDKNSNTLQDSEINNDSNIENENSNSKENDSTLENPEELPNLENKEEMRAVWISYIEFSSELDRLGKEEFSKQEFEEFINKAFDNCISWNMNTVIVHVRPYGDALYKSQYFPWSEYISGKQGKDPGFDPLSYMVKAAHERELRLEAWINPYRVATSTVKASSLSKDNQARKWMNASSAGKRRNVLAFGGNLYYNPAKKAVRDLITNGVKEIVENYDVDGIHFDDYFYPNLGDKVKPSVKEKKSNYKNYFDYKEYLNYIEDEEEVLSLVKWRRNNVNKLVKNVYSTIKEFNSETTFGISPAGNIDNLLSKNSYFVDIETWLSNSGYVDYICPQIYWTFDNNENSFDVITQEWLSCHENKEIKLYIGIPVYKAAAGKNSVWDWKQWNGKTSILKKQIIYCRDFDEIDGFCFFSYQDFIRKAEKKEIINLLSVLS